jgi:hypothetical protein
MKVKWLYVIAAVMVAAVVYALPSESRAAGGQVPDWSDFRLLPPVRILDTCAGLGAIPAAGRLDVQVTGRGGVPTDARAVALRLTATSASAPGFVAVFPAGSPPAGVPSLEVEEAGQTVSGSAVVGLSADGRFTLLASIRLDVVADVVGYWAAASAGERVPAPEALHADFLARSAAATTTRQKGDALEEYVCAVFRRLAGVIVHERHLRDDQHVQEIDVMLWNEQDSGPNGLSFLPHIIVVEAKNWTRPVGAAEVAWFKEKVRTSGDFAGDGAVGILVAAAGVTRDRADRQFAAGIIRDARPEGIKLLVVRPEHLVCDAAGLRDLLRRRLCDLAAGRVGLE